MNDTGIHCRLKLPKVIFIVYTNLIIQLRKTSSLVATYDKGRIARIIKSDDNRFLSCVLKTVIMKYEPTKQNAMWTQVNCVDEYTSITYTYCERKREFVLLI